jgi:methionyl-tRNA formyltransferase
LRIVFAGTPDFAARALAALLEAGHTVPLVLTQPDRPAGRGLKLQPSAVKALALERGLPVLQPQGLRIGGKYDADARIAHEALRATPHDAMVVAAYGLILPPSALEIPPRGCLNIHASLLPRWRGAAPVQRAIEAGDPETGIAIMQMDAGLDTGDVWLSLKIAISPSDTGGTLTAKLAELGGRAIVEALAGIARGRLTPTPQHAPDDPSAVTYATKLSKDESALDFTLPARALADRIRAFDPWPGTSAQLVGDEVGETFKIWAAHAVGVDPEAPPGTIVGVDDDGVAIATAAGMLVVTELQKPGGRRQPARQFRSDFDGAGRRFAPR